MSCTTFASRVAIEELRRLVFGSLPRFCVAALYRRALTGLLPTLERLFIASPSAEGYRSRSKC
jgi:hypothetical protein